MGNKKEEDFNGTARLLAIRKKVYDDNIKSFVAGVMEYMMQTGTKLIDHSNLYVHISFEAAEVYDFVIDKGDAGLIELDDYIAMFERKLRENRDAGIKRLIPDLAEGLLSKNVGKPMIFGKN